MRVWGIHRVATRFILAQLIRVRWLRRRSALHQCRIIWVRKAFTASLSLMGLYPGISRPTPFGKAYSLYHSAI